MMGLASVAVVGMWLWTKKPQQLREEGLEKEQVPGSEKEERERRESATKAKTGRQAGERRELLEKAARERREAADRQEKERLAKAEIGEQAARTLREVAERAEASRQEQERKEATDRQERERREVLVKAAMQRKEAAERAEADKKTSQRLEQLLLKQCTPVLRETRKDLQSRLDRILVWGAGVPPSPTSEFLTHWIGIFDGVLKQNTVVAWKACFNEMAHGRVDRNVIDAVDPGRDRDFFESKYTQQQWLNKLYDELRKVLG